MILLSVLLSYFSFSHWKFFYNFVPLLAGIFLDVVKDLAGEQKPFQSNNVRKSAMLELRLRQQYLNEPVALFDSVQADS